MLRWHQVVYSTKRMGCLLFFGVRFSSDYHYYLYTDTHTHARTRSHSFFFCYAWACGCFTQSKFAEMKRTGKMISNIEFGVRFDFRFSLVFPRSSIEMGESKQLISDISHGSHEFMVFCQAESKWNIFSYLRGLIESSDKNIPFGFTMNWSVVSILHELLFMQVSSGEMKRSTFKNTPPPPFSQKKTRIN